MTPPGWSGAEARAGVRPEHHEAVRMTAVSKGVPSAEMSAAQREQLRALLQVFVGRIPDELTEREAAKFAGDKLGEVHFAWAGGTERGQPYYYRLQGPPARHRPDRCHRAGHRLGRHRRRLLPARPGAGGRTPARYRMPPRGRAQPVPLIHQNEPAA